MARKRKRRYTRPTISELNEFRASLGSIESQYNDAELTQLYTEMNQMAKLLVDIYLYRNKLDRDV